MTVNRPLQRMFVSIPPRYDIINTIFTLGMDKIWRRKAAIKCLSSKPLKFLDLCCGTGDLTITINNLSNKSITVIGIDYSLPMLQIADKKARAIVADKSIDYIHGDASRLPFANNSLDCVGISFAFRNLTYRNPLSQAHFTEVLRVLKENGQYVILESSQPKSKILRKMFKVYLHFFVYWVGYLISGNKGAYRYLTQSAANFYSPGEVADLLINAGFKKVDYHPLFFGAVGIHVAKK